MKRPSITDTQNNGQWQ